MMTDSLDYGTKQWEEVNEDGTTSIVEEGYYAGVRNKHKITVRKDIITSKDNWVKDLLSELSPVKGDSPTIGVQIKKDKFNNPFLIQVTWITVNYHKKIK